MNYETNEISGGASSAAENKTRFDMGELAVVESLTELFARTPGLTLLEVRAGESSSLRLRRRPNRTFAAESSDANRLLAPATTIAEQNSLNVPAPLDTAAVGTEEPARNNTGNAAADTPITTKVSALLVGVFRVPMGRSAPPNPLSVGSAVRERDILGRIEALGILTDCVAPVSGTIASVAVQEGQPVEYGQTLFELRQANVQEQGQIES